MVTPTVVAIGSALTVAELSGYLSACQVTIFTCAWEKNL